MIVNTGIQLNLLEYNKAVNKKLEGDALKIHECLSYLEML